MNAVATPALEATIVTIAPQQASELVALGEAIATGHKEVGSKERRYAAVMNLAFPGWYRLTEKDDSNEAKALKAGPKAKLFEQLKAAKHTNPSTVWARLRRYAAEEENVITGDGNESEGEGEGEGDTKAAKRAIEVRLVEEILKLRKAIAKEQTPPEKVRAVDTFLELALSKLGVTVEAEQAKAA